MPPRRSRRRMLARLMAAALACHGAAGAEITAALVSAPSARAAPPAVAAPYEDRVLESGPQPDLPEGEADGDDLKGWARALRLDYVLGAQRGPTDSNMSGLALDGYIDTPQHGTLSLQANLLRSSMEGQPAFGLSETRTHWSTWRVDQRAFPLEGSWLADHSAGDIYTLVPDLGRGVSRVFLPSTPVSGLGGHWQRADGLELNASVGRPGVFSGLDVSGFERSRGWLATAGGQARLSTTLTSRWDAALEVRGRRTAGGQPAVLETRSFGRAALSWEGTAPWARELRIGNGTESMATRPGGARVQLSTLQSSGPDGDATGLWVDGTWRTQSVQNTAGMFRFDPGLRWGAMGMPADLRGAYLRGDLPRRQWQLGWSAETAGSVSGHGGESHFGSLYGRYLLSLRHAIDATLAVRTGDSEAHSLQVNWDQQSDYGRTRWRTSFLRARGWRTTFLGVDQAWALSAPNVLASSLGWQSTDEPGVASPIWTWGLLASASPVAGLTLDASLSGAHGGGYRSLVANIGLQWQFARHWALALRYTDSRGQDPQSAEVVSALTAATQALVAPRVTNRSLQLNLRYEMRAGTVPVPLGGSRLGGAGSLGGTVVMDADRNGRREASEQGVPNVIVVLDNRYVARTDAAGRYEFPSVAAGNHVVQVHPDGVPLPWSPVNPDPVRTTVLVRGSTVEDFPLQRER